MRKIIVLSFISLDGVMQAPGGPGEDTSGNFRYGGWVAPFFNDGGNDMYALMEKQMKPADLLLGRKTFDIFESYWPAHADSWPGINEVTKYVLSKTRKDSEWQNSFFMDNVDDILRLKNSEGRDMQVHGSGEMVQTLLENDLADELWLKIFPITLGAGKKLFANGTAPAAFTLNSTEVTRNGVIFANYSRNGDVRTGTVGE